MSRLDNKKDINNLLSSNNLKTEELFTIVYNGKKKTTNMPPLINSAVLKINLLNYEK
jgi:hypothetical protein